MTLLRSVVGKLWMTIIALVAVVLIILGLFLFPIIDATFPDQAGNLQKMADKLSRQIPSHIEDKGYFEAVVDLLETEEASVNLISLEKDKAEESSVTLEGKPYRLGDIFTGKELLALQAGQKVSASFSLTAASRANDGKYLIIASPVMDSGGGGEQDILLLYQSKKTLDSTQNYVKWLFALVSLAGFLLTTFFAFFLIYKINRPLLELKRTANHFIRGEYGSRVTVMSRDEIGELSNTFNLMGEQLEETIKDLSHQKDNLASVLRSMADAVISFDVDGRIIFMNPEGESLLYAWSDLNWSKDAADEEDDDSDEPAAYRLIPEPLQGVYEQVVEETKEIATKIHVKDGVWSVVMAPLYSEDDVRGAVVVLRDVTEEYRLDKLRRDFVANVSHELRTPLSMLQGYSEALIDDIASTPEERQELARIIYDESLRMGRLVRDLLDLAKMETGNLEYHFHSMDISAFMRRMHRKFSAYCKEHGIQLELALEEEPLFAMADEDRLEQVLTNLLDNAVRHTPSGAAIHLKAGLSVLRGDKAVALEVRDEGQGIPAEDLSFIFERFYKADKARTRGSSGGTGLGLAIAKNIVDAHKGIIQVKSKVGQGTTFTMQLPLA